MKKNIKAIIFDYGGVISTLQNHQEVIKMSKILQLSIDTFKESYRKYRHDYDSHLITAHKYWQKICHDNNIICTDSMIPRLIELDIKSWVVLNREMIQYIMGLKEYRVKKAIISNMTIETLEYMKRQFHWLDIFDCLVFSCDLKKSKPDKIIYNTCLESLHLPAHECVFIDDTYENIKGAAELGFNTIHFQTYKQFKNEVDNNYILHR